MLMRLFSFFDKHSLQKIRSQHLVQINLVVDCMIDEIIITKAKLQVINDAITICSKKASENSEI